MGSPRPVNKKPINKSRPRRRDKRKKIAKLLIKVKTDCISDYDYNEDEIIEPLPEE